MLSSLKAPVAIIQNYIAGLCFICISFKHSAFRTRFLYVALLHCSHMDSDTRNQESHLQYTLDHIACSYM